MSLLLSFLNPIIRILIQHVNSWTLEGVSQSFQIHFFYSYQSESQQQELLNCGQCIFSFWKFVSLDLNLSYTSYFLRRIQFGLSRSSPIILKEPYPILLLEPLEHLCSSRPFKEVTRLLHVESIKQKHIRTQQIKHLI